MKTAAQRNAQGNASRKYRKRPEGAPRRSPHGEAVDFLTLARAFGKEINVPTGVDWALGYAIAERYAAARFAQGFTVDDLMSEAVYENFVRACREPEYALVLTQKPYLIAQITRAVNRAVAKRLAAARDRRTLAMSYAFDAPSGEGEEDAAGKAAIRAGLEGRRQVVVDAAALKALSMDDRRYLAAYLRQCAPGSAPIRVPGEGRHKGDLNLAETLGSWLRHACGQSPSTASDRTKRILSAIKEGLYVA